MVGETGFEPATLWSQTRCATKLRYSPSRLESAQSIEKRVCCQIQLILPLETFYDVVRAAVLGNSSLGSTSMRLLIAVLSVIWVSKAFAQETEVKYSGEFRARYQNHRNTTAQQTDTTTNQSTDKTDVDHRFKLNLSARKGESLQAGLTLLHASGWGEANDPAAPTAATGGTGIPSSRDEFDRNNSALVNRAWGWWKANDSLSFRFGRVGIEFADGSVFSENDYEQFPVAHDGLLAFWDINLGRFTFLGVKNREFGAGTLTGDAEENMYGFAFDFKNVPSFIKMMNVHFLQITQDETGTAPLTTRDNRQHLGFAMGGDFFGFLYKGSGAYQLGKTEGNASGTAYSANNNAWMVDLLAGYQAQNFSGFKLTAGYHADTGDKNTSDRGKNEAYNPLFYDRHSYAGLMDVLRWGNLTYWSANLSLIPVDDLETGISYLDFTRSSTGTAVTAATYGPFYSLADVTTEKNLGSEVDVYVNKTYASSGFVISGRFGMFMPGAAMKDQAIVPPRNQNIYQWFLQGAMVF